MAHKLIIVDDEPEFREWLRSLIGNYRDFSVVGEATTGEEAIGLIKLLAPDLVILDVYLPAMDGFEVIQYMRHHFPRIKVILISAYAERVYERLAKEEGALAFIPKAQFSLQALRQTLQQAG